jgi:hypothetical protein
MLRRRNFFSQLKLRRRSKSSIVLVPGELLLLDYFIKNRKSFSALIRFRIKMDHHGWGQRKANKSLSLASASMLRENQSNFRLPPSLAFDRDERSPRARGERKVFNEKTATANEWQALDGGRGISIREGH